MSQFIIDIPLHLIILILTQLKRVVDMNCSDKDTAVRQPLYYRWYWCS